MQNDQELRGLSGKCWQDDRFAEFEGGRNNPSANVGEVILVAVADFFDQAMRTQSFEQLRSLSGCERREVGTQVAGAKAAGGPLAPCEGEEQVIVTLEQEVEAPVGTFCASGRLTDFVDGAILDSNELFQLLLAKQY